MEIEYLKIYPFGLELKVRKNNFENCKNDGGNWIGGIDYSGEKNKSKIDLTVNSEYTVISRSIISKIFSLKWGNHRGWKEILARKRIFLDKYAHSKKYSNEHILLKK